MADDQRSSPVLIAVLVLVSLNLALTAVVLTRVDNSHASAESKTSELPAYLDAQALKAIATSIQKPYNASDVKALRQLMDPLARTQFTEEMLTKEIAQLRQMAGDIVEMEYTGHDNGELGDHKVYTLYYRARYSGGSFETGTVKISVVDRGDHAGIIGFNIGSN